MPLLYLLLASLAAAIAVKAVPRDLSGVRGACIRVFAEHFGRAAWTAVAVSLLYVVMGLVLWSAIRFEIFTLAGLRIMEGRLHALAEGVQAHVPPAWVFLLILAVLLSLSVMASWWSGTSSSRRVIHVHGPKLGWRAKFAGGLLRVVARVFAWLGRGRKVLTDASMVLSLVAASTFLTGNATLMTGIPTAALTDAQSGLAGIEEELEKKSRQLTAEELVDRVLAEFHYETRTSLVEIYRAAEEDDDDFAAAVLERYDRVSGADRLAGQAWRGLRGPGGGPGGDSGSRGGPGKDTGPRASPERGPGSGAGEPSQRQSWPRPGWDSWGRQFGPGDVEPRYTALRQLDVAAARSGRAAVDLPERIRKAAVDATAGILANPQNVAFVREAVADNVLLSAIVDSLSAPVQEVARQGMEQAYSNLEGVIRSPNATPARLQAEAASFRLEGVMRVQVESTFAGQVSNDMARLTQARERARAATRPPTTTSRGTTGSSTSSGTRVNPGTLPGLIERELRETACTPPLVPCYCGTVYVGCRFESSCRGPCR